MHTPARTRGLVRIMWFSRLTSVYHVAFCGVRRSSLSNTGPSHRCAQAMRKQWLTIAMAMVLCTAQAGVRVTRKSMPVFVGCWLYCMEEAVLNLLARTFTQQGGGAMGFNCYLVVAPHYIVPCTVQLQLTSFALPFHLFFHSMNKPNRKQKWKNNGTGAILSDNHFWGYVLSLSRDF